MTQAPEYRLVPVEPTEAMIEAAAKTPGMRAIDASSSIMQARGYPLDPAAFEGGSPLAQAYRAMLAAAPHTAAPAADRGVSETFEQAWQRRPMHGAGTPVDGPREKALVELGWRLAHDAAPPADRAELAAEALRQITDIPGGTTGSALTMAKGIARGALDALARSTDAPSGLSMAQEPKYTVTRSAIVNRASGEAIPADEPVFIFRARDAHAREALESYACVLKPGEHRDAVCQRVADFAKFSFAHPERMREPDTNALATPPAAATSTEPRATAESMHDLGFAAECRLLRRLLCNAYAGSLTYNDDGEAQDNRAFPAIDFLRDSAALIKSKMEQRGLIAVLAATSTEAPVSTPGASGEVTPKCDHLKHLLTGYEKGYYTAWCGACGRLTHQDDALTSGRRESCDFSNWCSANIAAFGCEGEATSGRGGIYGTEKKGSCKVWCGSTACPKTLNSALAASQAPQAKSIRVEAYQCVECGHEGINDAHATEASCNRCPWHGPSPKEDKCPECGEIGTMSTACPECGGLYSVTMEANVSTRATQAPAVPTTDARADFKWHAVDGKQHDTGRVTQGERGSYFATTANPEDARLIAEALNARTPTAGNTEDARSMGAVSEKLKAMATQLANEAGGSPLAFRTLSALRLAIDAALAQAASTGGAAS